TAVEQRYRADHLERALASSRQIGAAMGILMARLRFTEEQAFDALRTASQHSHRKLRDVAEEVLLTGELPKAPPSARHVAANGHSV
ncbi:MAG TPA: ANTAR domain-containing protein, partial [Jatrophihabitans sp.]|nr:ANTAR domain-containing protein [Jatrophihabitans sp.]